MRRQIGPLCTGLRRHECQAAKRAASNPNPNLSLAPTLNPNPHECQAAKRAACSNFSLLLWLAPSVYDNQLVRTPQNRNNPSNKTVA